MAMDSFLTMAGAYFVQVIDLHERSSGTPQLPSLQRVTLRRRRQRALGEMTPIEFEALPRR